MVPSVWPTSSDYYFQAKLVMFCDRYFEKWGRMDGRTKRAKIMITTSWDCGSAEWINMTKHFLAFLRWQLQFRALKTWESFFLSICHRISEKWHMLQWTERTPLFLGKRKSFFLPYFLQEGLILIREPEWRILTGDKIWPLHEQLFIFFLCYWPQLGLN